MGSTLYQLSWQSGFVALFHYPSLRSIGKMPLRGEGWGLTSSAQQFYLSNGSDTLYTYSSRFTPVSKVAVTFGTEAVDQLNELEYVNGKIWANRWYSDTVYVIDPTTGIVEKYVDFSDLTQGVGSFKEGSVLNGIAYDSTNNLYYITGKFWPYIYVVELEK